MFLKPQRSESGVGVTAENEGEAEAALHLNGVTRSGIQTAAWLSPDNAKMNHAFPEARQLGGDAVEASV